MNGEFAEASDVNGEFAEASDVNEGFAEASKVIGEYAEASLPRPAKWSEEFAKTGEVVGRVCQRP